jgi:hypothetical protein
LDRRYSTFIRRPETAKALKPLEDIKEEISFYGYEFLRVINELYADDVKPILFILRKKI